MIKLTEAQEAKLQKLVDAGEYDSIQNALDDSVHCLSESFHSDFSEAERAEVLRRIEASDRGERMEFDSREEMEAYFNRRIAERKVERAKA